MSINTLVGEIKQATDFQKNKLKLKEQVETDLLVAHESGLFKTSPELIAFLSCWDQPELFLEDVYGNPIRCQRDALLNQCKQQYQKVMNRWHNQYEQLRQVRKI